MAAFTVGQSTLDSTDTLLGTSGITNNDSGSGTITLSGTFAQSAVFTDARSGTITLSGSFAQSQTGSGSGIGTVTLSGSSTQSLSATESRSGTITLSGLFTQSAVHTGSGTGTITLSGTSTEQHGIIFNDSGAGTVTLSGTSTESFTGGGSSFKPFLFPQHSGLSRLANIKEWLFENTTFVDYPHSGKADVDTIEEWLRNHPVNAVTFHDYTTTGTDRLWAIESYLLTATGSNG